MLKGVSPHGPVWHAWCQGPAEEQALCRFDVEGQPSMSSDSETATSTAPLLSRLVAAGASCVGCTTSDDLHLGYGSEVSRD